MRHDQASAEWTVSVDVEESSPHASEQTLIKSHNAPQNSADFGKTRFGPKTFGTLAKEAGLSESYFD
jgi:hypothetical protein